MPDTFEDDVFALIVNTAHNAHVTIKPGNGGGAFLTAWTDAGALLQRGYLTWAEAQAASERVRLRVTLALYDGGAVA